MGVQLLRLPPAVHVLGDVRALVDIAIIVGPILTAYGLFARHVMRKTRRQQRPVDEIIEENERLDELIRRSQRKEAG